METVISCFTSPQAERARKAAEAERSESADRIAELSAQVNSLTQAKRKLDGQVHTLQVSTDSVLCV